MQKQTSQLCIHPKPQRCLPTQVIWNAPTESCKRDYGVDVNVTKYGILENPVDGWHGPTVVVVG